MEKFFDKIQPRSVDAVWHHAGLDPHERAILQSIFVQAKRRFKLSFGILGPEFQPERGLAQGCAFSCAAANAMVAPLLYGLQNLAAQHQGTIHVSSYVDDLVILADSADLLARADQHVREYVRMVGFALHPHKCKKFQAGGRGQPPRPFSDLEYQRTWTVEILKCIIILHGGRQEELVANAEQRFREAQRRLRRLRALPPRFDRKLCLAGAGIMTKLTYVPVGGPPCGGANATIHAADASYY